MLGRRGKIALKSGDGLILIDLDSAKQVVWKVAREARSGLPDIVGAKSRLPHKMAASYTKGKFLHRKPLCGSVGNLPDKTGPN